MKDKLFEIMTEADTLQQYVDETAVLAGNPYWIMDSSFHVIAVSNTADARPYYRLFEKNESLVQHIKDWVRDGIVGGPDGHARPMVIHDSFYDIDLMIMDVFDRSLPIGRITVFLQNPMDEDMCVLLTRGAAVYMRNDHKEANHDAISQAFVAMLRGENAGDCVQLMLQAGYRGRSPYRICCLQADVPEILMAFGTDVRVKDEEIPSVLHDSCLYLLESEGHSAEQWMPEEIRSGSSYPFSDLSCIRDYGKQALFSVKQGMRIDQCSVSYAAALLANEADLHTLIDPRVASCMEYDRRYHTDYCQTLICLLRCSLSKKKTAEMLNVHLNTVKYRLAQMEMLFGIRADEDAQELLISTIAASAVLLKN